MGPGKAPTGSRFTLPPEPLKIIPFPGIPRDRGAAAIPGAPGSEAPAPAGGPAGPQETAGRGPDEEGVARLHMAEDLETLCRALGGLLADRGLTGRFTFLTRDEASPEVQVSHSTDIPPEDRESIRLHPSDPLLAEVGPGQVFLTGPGEPFREISLPDRSVPVSAVLGFQASIDGGPVGWILLHGSQATPPPMIPALQRLTAHFELALRRLRELDVSHRGRVNSETALTAMNEMGAIMGTLDLQLLLTRIIELALRLSGAEVGSILEYRQGVLHARVEWGFGEAELDSIRLQDGRTLVEATLASGEAEYVPDVYLDPRLDTGQDPLLMESIVILPLMTAKGALGVINLVNVSEERGFTPELLSTLRTMSSLAAVAVENARYHEEAIETEKLKEQARIAETIQRGFFPRRIPGFPGHDLAGRTAPAQFVGGDYYDFIPLGTGRLGIAVADVSGHGISSGLVMAMTRTLFRAEAIKGALPSELLGALNAHLVAEDMNGAFVTFLYAVMDRERSEIRFSSAGHTPLLHYRAVDDAIEHLELDGLPLGLFPEAEYQERVVETSPGDCFLFLTDGLLEAMTPRREPFGRERLEAAFRSLRNKPADEVLENLHQAVFEFTRPATPHDDVSTVLVKVLPQG